jgi:hypothetical protein
LERNGINAYQLVTATSGLMPRFMWISGRDYLAHFGMVSKTGAQGSTFLLDAPFLTLASFMKYMYPAFVAMTREHFAANPLTPIGSAETLMRAAVAINGPDTRYFPSRESLKAERVDRRTVSFAKKFLQDMVYIAADNKLYVKEKVKSLGHLMRWMELMQSEENVDRNELMERVLAEMDKDIAKANALIVLKRAIKQFSRDGTKFPSNKSMTERIYKSGMAYLKQFGLTTVNDGTKKNSGIFISSESVFQNLGELYDYVCEL